MSGSQKHQTSKSSKLSKVCIACRRGTPQSLTGGQPVLEKHCFFGSRHASAVKENPFLGLGTQKRPKTTLSPMSHAHTHTHIHDMGSVQFSSCKELCLPSKQNVALPRLSQQPFRLLCIHDSSTFQQALALGKGCSIPGCSCGLPLRPRQHPDRPCGSSTGSFPPIQRWRCILEKHRLRTPQITADILLYRYLFMP